MAARLTLLVSIRPRFADAIMRGEKRFELRRRRPKLDPGATVIVYSSTPKRALVGSFVAPEVIVEPLDVLWRRVKESACISRNEFDHYFAGLSSGVAIGVASPQLFVKPVSLAELRHCWPGFCPPQSFRYLSQSQLDALSCSLRSVA